MVTNIEFEYANGFDKGATGVNVSFSSYNNMSTRDYISGIITLTIDEYNSFNGSPFEEFNEFVVQKIIEKITNANNSNGEEEEPQE